MAEITPDLSNANRCISVHWSLPVQCERSNRHFEYWHWARHPETGNRIRYRRSFGVHATEELRDGEWQALAIPAPVRHDVPTLLAEVERLTAEGVAASERRDYFQARCEQMERDHAETVAEVERLRVQVATWRKATDNSGLAIAKINRERGEAQDRASAAEAEVERLRAAERRVRDRHPREDGPAGPVCGTCRDAYEEPVDWPCGTIYDLDGGETP